MFTFSDQYLITMGFDVEPLKEPRGFLRLMQWFLAMIAFATCCDFSVQFGFKAEIEVGFF